MVRVWVMRGVERSWGLVEEWKSAARGYCFETETREPLQVAEIFFIFFVVKALVTF